MMDSMINSLMTKNWRQNILRALALQNRDGAKLEHY